MAFLAIHSVYIESQYISRLNASQALAFVCPSNVLNQGSTRPNKPQHTLNTEVPLQTRFDSSPDHGSRKTSRTYVHPQWYILANMCILLQTKLPPGANRILFVKNLNYQITGEDLYDLFGRYGSIRQIRIGSEAKTKGTAFVVFEDVMDVRTLSFCVSTMTSTLTICRPKMLLTIWMVSICKSVISWSSTICRRNRMRLQLKQISQQERRSWRAWRSNTTSGMMSDWCASLYLAPRRILETISKPACTIIPALSRQSG